MLRISNNRITTADYVQAGSFGGPLNRDLMRYVVAHDTAGRSAESTVQYLNRNVKASYHVVIARDGTMTQLVSLACQAHHAGRSALPDKPWVQGLNRCSYGIAFDSPGQLDEHGTSWFGERYTDAVPDATGALWRPYTDEQLRTFETLVETLDYQYDIAGVYSHRAVATPAGRKNDTSPLLDGFLRAMHHRVEDKQVDFPMSERGVVNATGGLNLRAEPHRMGRIIETMPLWTALNIEPPALDNGYVMVTTDDGQTGYAHSHYIQGA